MTQLEEHFWAARWIKRTLPLKTIIYSQKIAPGYFTPKNVRDGGKRNKKVKKHITQVELKGMWDNTTSTFNRVWVIMTNIAMK